MQIDLESKLEISIDPATNDSLANYSENWALNVQTEREFPLICFSERERESNLDAHWLEPRRLETA